MRKIALIIAVLVLAAFAGWKFFGNNGDHAGKGEIARSVIVKIAAGQGEPEERTIHVGLMDRTEAEIRDGLVVGEQIVLPPASQPASGNGGQGFRGGARL